MNLNHRFVILMLMVLVAISISAQEYTLDSCVAMAMRSNKQIQAYQHQANKYRYTHDALVANYYPKISLQAADVYSTLNSSTTVDIATPVGQFAGDQLHEIMPRLIRGRLQQNITNDITNRLTAVNPEVDLDVNNVFVASLQLQQPLYMGGKIISSTRMGEIGARMASLGVELAREEVRLSVYEAYNLLIKANELLLVAKKYDSLLVQLTHDVNSALKHGMASHNDEMKVMVKKNDAELKVRQAENGIKLARMNLCQLVGLPLDTPIDPIEEETNVDNSIERNPSLSNRTEYMLLELKEQLAEQKVNLEKSEMRPQLALLMQGGLMDGIELMDSKMFGAEPFFNIGAVLNIPIFHGFETRSKIRVAQEELYQERLNRQDLVGKMNLEIQQYANMMDEAALEVTLRNRNLEQCDENLRISRKAYSVGLESLSDLLTAQLLWQQAYADMVEAKYQLKIKTTKWRKAAGRIK